MANRGMGRGSQRRTVGGLRMDALIARLWEAERQAQAPVTTGADALARINLLCGGGRTDRRPDGENRAWPVRVFDDGQWLEGRTYVQSLGECLLIAFFLPGKRMRRLLVVPGADGRPECWLQTREDMAHVFPHRGKYARAAVTLIAARAHETEQVGKAA
jgi:hypothetical protein